MNNVDFVTLNKFKELLGLFRKSFSDGQYELAGKTITCIRKIVDSLNQNQELMQSLTENPKEVKGMTTSLLKYFHAVAERKQSQTEDEQSAVERRNNEIQLMWRLWPVLHRLLVLQSNVDFDHEDYSQKVAELYGVIAQSMESPRAVRILKECIDQVLPLPRI